MDTEANAGGAEGTGGTGGAPSGGQPQGEKGTPKGGAGDSGVGGLPLDVLPEPMRGMPANQIKFILQNATTAVQNTAKENRRLQAQLEELQKGGGKKRGPGRPPKQADTGQDDGGDEGEDDFESMMKTNPKQAIAMAVQEAFGQEIGSLREGVGDVYFSQMRQEFPDFKDHEDTVREIIETQQVPANKDNLRGAYLMAKGHAAVQAERQKTTQDDNVEAGTNRPAEGKDAKKELTSLQKEIARGLNMTDEQYIAAQDSWESGNHGIKVPMGTPRKKEEAK